MVVNNDYVILLVYIEQGLQNAVYHICKITLSTKLY